MDQTIAIVLHFHRAASDRLLCARLLNAWMLQPSGRLLAAPRVTACQASHQLSTHFGIRDLLRIVLKQTHKFRVLQRPHELVSLLRIVGCAVGGFPAALCAQTAADWAKSKQAAAGLQSWV
jgi:hypothetical protein